MLRDDQLEALWVYEHFEEWVKTLEPKRQVAARLWLATGNERLAEYLFAPLFFPNKAGVSLNVAAFIGLKRCELVGA